MAPYTVRVELHSDHYPDFETLHAAMAREGFSKFITSDTGVTYHLPRAEYDIWSSAGRAAVLATAERAVRATGKTAEVLVTESAGRTWSGLTSKG